MPASDLADLVLRMLDPDPSDRPDVNNALVAFGEIADAAGRPAWPTWARPSGIVTTVRHPSV